MSAVTSIPNLTKAKKAGARKRTRLIAIVECADCPGAALKLHPCSDGGYRCSDCALLRNKAVDNDKRSTRHLYKKYGVTKERYQQLLASQQGLCAICQKTSNIQLAVDHDHSTGEIRQLLCQQCNAGLGLFSEREDILLAAINYLRKHKPGP